MLSPWVRELTPEQLPEPYQSIARQIGLEPALTLAEYYQGTGLYLPKLDGALAQIRNRRICAEFRGDNHKELAVKYGLTERWIYEIVHAGRDLNQVSLYDGKGS